MKCNNCNKEIVDSSQNFCTNCGETLNKYTNLGELVSQSNTGLTKEKIGKAKEVFLNNKKIVGIISAVVVAIVILIGVFSFMSGRPMNESKIKHSIIGQSIYVSGRSVTITEDNLKSIKIVSRNTIKKSSDFVELELDLELEEATVTINYSVEYHYSEEWIFSSGYVRNVVSVNPTSNPEDKIKEILKEKGVRFQIGGSVYGDAIKEISNIEVTGEGTERGFKADILLSNGVVYQKGKVEGDVDFNLSDFTWNTSYVYIVSSEDVKVEEKVDEEGLKGILKGIIGGNNSGRYYNYKFNVGENTKISTFTITKDMISSLTIKSYLYLEEDKSIRVEVDGKVTGDLVKELSFSGVVLLNSSFDKSIEKNTDINITAASVDEIKIDRIKELLLDKRVDNTKITTDIANTFVEEKRNVEEISKEYINGKITINGEVNPVQVQVQLALKDGKYSWILSGVYKEDSFIFKKFE